MDRRGLLAGLTVAPLVGAVCAREALGGENGPPLSPAREAIRARYFPNVVLTTQHGRKVRFYDDLIKDKIVVINLMYTKCTGICSGITANLAKVQKLLGDRVGRDIFIYSITIKPEEDTPALLKKYAETFHAKPAWLFLTGKPEDIELLRRRLGFVDPNPEVDKDKSRHSGVLRYGNEALALWATCQGQARPEWIAESISWVDWPKRKRQQESP